MDNKTIYSNRVLFHYKEAIADRAPHTKTNDDEDVISINPARILQYFEHSRARNNFIYQTPE